MSPTVTAPVIHETVIRMLRRLTPVFSCNQMTVSCVRVGPVPPDVPKTTLVTDDFEVFSAAPPITTCDCVVRPAPN